MKEYSHTESLQDESIQMVSLDCCGKKKVSPWWEASLPWFAHCAGLCATRSKHSIVVTNNKMAWLQN